MFGKQQTPLLLPDLGFTLQLTALIKRGSNFYRLRLRPPLMSSAMGPHSLSSLLHHAPLVAAFLHLLMLLLLHLLLV